MLTKSTDSASTHRATSRSELSGLLTADQHSDGELSVEQTPSQFVAKPCVQSSSATRCYDPFNWTKLLPTTDLLARSVNQGVGMITWNISVVATDRQPVDKSIDGSTLPLSSKIAGQW